MNKAAEKMECGLCPHGCRLAPGQKGLCGTRINQEGTIHSISYGQITSLALDPIEKKPLYHFCPGSYILSLGSFGCNMKCPFCQNHEISQKGMEVVQGQLSPADLRDIALKTAREGGSIGVAFTYNEPLLNYEYLLEVAPLLKECGQKVVLVTNGQIMEKPLGRLLPHVDAMNIDLKVFSEDGYKWMGGDFTTVKNTIAASVRAGIHVELTTLVIPEVNDEPAMMEEEAKWIRSLDKSIPLHLSRYFPRYRLRTEATPITVLEKLQTVAGKYLDYVYLGNV
ncbi:MAG: AmmeMemoRadiSam system radical SAM enzyme [Anaerovibrio sp.]|uniref:AmmeMemoRadiSam system radical SAM enzyme n=1 Tax=Anaerovibrio sp. TaxID=1872532 RepID=UPI0025EA1142|nr:AmmeMemoRadiSam system radical SAM enzyme [Anaerovibrio sp.]MCR5176952.1 AmmeMemoRadiSam system radical SAM enzyme [Anaerovibrio sp.]